MPLSSEPSTYHHPATSEQELKRQDPKTHNPKKEAVASPTGSALLRRKKVCPKCCDIISVAHAHCPRCHTVLSDWTFPLPDEHTAEQSSRSLCHSLGIRKQGGVIVVRFGEHRILNEMIIKKFGEELFHVADRPDCENLLLNFTGVVGLSSAMLGIMLMLRKKMGLKNRENSSFARSARRSWTSSTPRNLASSSRSSTASSRL